MGRAFEYRKARKMKRWGHMALSLIHISIGHALICDALYYGLENTVQLYKRELR